MRVKYKNIFLSDREVANSARDPECLLFDIVEDKSDHDVLWLDKIEFVRRHMDRTGSPFQRGSLYHVHVEVVRPSGGL